MSLLGTTPRTGESTVATATPPQHGDRREWRRAVAAVGLALLLGAVLRVPFTGAYLPYQHHWDEMTNITVGEGMAGTLSADPGFYNYPALVFLVQEVVLIPANLFTGLDLESRRVRDISGLQLDDGSILEIQTNGNGYVREPGLLRAMRWATGLVPNLVMVAAAGAIAWTVSRRWWPSGLAALLAALSTIDLRFGMVVTPDALAGAAATLAVLAAVRLALQPAPSSRAYALAGAALGLSAAAKYNAAVVVVPILVAHAFASGGLLARRRLLVVLAAAAAGVFFLVNIGGLLHPTDFVREFGSEGAHYSRGHFGSEGNSPVFNASWLWRAFGVGLPLCAGVFLARSRPMRRLGLVVASFVLAYYVFISAFPVRFARNLTPVTGSIAALAAIGAYVLVQRVREARPGRFAPLSLVAGSCVLVALVLLVPVNGAADALGDLRQDPWTETQRWVADNVPEGSKVVVETRAPYIDPERYEVLGRAKLGKIPPERYVQTEVDYLVASSETFKPHLDDPSADPETTASYEALLADECIVFEARGAGTRLVVTTPPPCG